MMGFNVFFWIFMIFLLFLVGVYFWNVWNEKKKDIWMGEIVKLLIFYWTLRQVEEVFGSFLVDKNTIDIIQCCFYQTVEWFEMYNGVKWHALCIFVSPNSKSPNTLYSFTKTKDQLNVTLKNSLRIVITQH